MADTEGTCVRPPPPSPLSTIIILIPSVGLKSNRLLFTLLELVLIAQPREIRRVGYRAGVGRPTPRAGQSHIPTLTVRRRTRHRCDVEEIRVWCYSFHVQLVDVHIYRMHLSLYREIFPFPPHNTTPCIRLNTSHLRPTGLETSKNSTQWWSNLRLPLMFSYAFRPYDLGSSIRPRNLGPFLRSADSRGRLGV